MRTSLVSQRQKAMSSVKIPTKLDTLKADRYRFVDLFAGVGGFHTGLAIAGHQCVFCVRD